MMIGPTEYPNASYILCYYIVEVIYNDAPTGGHGL